MSAEMLQIAKFHILSNVWILPTIIWTLFITVKIPLMWTNMKPRDFQDILSDFYSIP